MKKKKEIDYRSQPEVMVDLIKEYYDKSWDLSELNNEYDRFKRIYHRKEWGRTYDEDCKNIEFASKTASLKYIVDSIRMEIITTLIKEK